MNLKIIPKVVVLINGKFHIYSNWNIPFIYLSTPVMTLHSNTISHNTYTPKNNTWLIKRWRKKIPRKVNYTPTLTIWQPTDWVKNEGNVILWHDELEALRLKSVNWLGVISAASQMWISKSLFAKIYNEAVSKVTNALIHGRSLHIQVRDTNDYQEPLIK